MLAHPGNRRLHGIQRAENVDIEKLAEMINTLVGYKGSTAQSCIVDKDVEMAIIDAGGVDQVLPLCLISYISRNSQRLLPQLSQFFHYRVDRLTRAGRQDNFRTCAGETACSCPPDA